MSGNQEFPGKGGAIGPRARELTEAELEHSDVLLSLFEKHLVGTRANGKKQSGLLWGLFEAFRNLLAYRLGNGKRTMYLSFSHIRSRKLILGSDGKQPT